MIPTPEQDHALGVYRTGRPMVLEAFAGTGKTTTIVQLASSKNVRGTYVAYNRAIVDDVQAKLQTQAPSITARTAHSLAYGQVGHKFRHRLHDERMSSRKVAELLRLDSLTVKVRGATHRLSPAFLAGCVMEGTRHFANSASSTPNVTHLPRVEGLDNPGEQVNDDSYRDHCLVALLSAWADLSTTSGSLRFTHDCYLKLWQLGDAKIAGDVLFIDEAQDVNPVLADVVMRQGSQLVAVGDSYQQIYAWRGAIDALAELKQRPGTVSGRLTVSFRFGPEIAEVANHLLGLLGCDAELQGAGAPGAVGRSENPDAILCRTNAGVVSALLDHAGMRPVAIVGGGGELTSFAKGLIALRDTGSTIHPELVCFSSVAELQAYVADDPSGSDLALLTNLCLRYGPETLIDAVQHTVPEAPGVLSLSTAHKAKGREWPVVRLGSDWPERTFDTPDELRLAYVACTRARQILDLSECPVLEGALT